MILPASHQAQLNGNKKELELIFLGTGYSRAVLNYNACFVINNKNHYFLIDGGGGNTLLKQLYLKNISVNEIHDIFLSHSHMDHMVGLIWFIKEVIKELNSGNYRGCLNIYCSKDTFKDLIKSLNSLMGNDYKRSELKFIVVEPDKNYEIIGLNFNFFDLGAKKIPIYGFYFNYYGKRVVFTGDESIKESTLKYIKNCDYLIAESLCLERQREEFHPKKSYQSTVKEVSEIAQTKKVKNLILFHTIDNLSKSRVNLFSREAREYFSGKIYIPEDLEIIRIS